jgi:aspartate/methionine/tyrosine aminotransferase
VDLGGLILRYGDHRGLLELRERVAADGGRSLPSDATPLAPEHVLATVGAAGALFLIATSLLEAGDEIVVVRPNYATNLETPRAIRADVRILDLSYEEGWQVDPERIAGLLTPQTRLVSVTNPHNPTGAVMNAPTLRAILDLVEAHPRAHLLVDETYREMTFGGPLPPVAALSSRAIGVSSLSKSYGLPGIRLGWLTTRDPGLLMTLLAAKEQIHITGSLVDETIGARALARREALLPERFGTAVGPGHWFEQPRTHFRLGYGWPTLEELRAGLAAISLALDAATVR